LVVLHGNTHRCWGLTGVCQNISCRLSKDFSHINNQSETTARRYVEWVANIVLVEKKGTSKIKICVDLQNLNRATPKDEYPMPVAKMLINNASGNKVISFLDENARYK
jgi:hypothetical protein